MAPGSHCPASALKLKRACLALNYHRELRRWGSATLSGAGRPASKAIWARCQDHGANAPPCLQARLCSSGCSDFLEERRVWSWPCHPLRVDTPIYPVSGPLLPLCHNPALWFGCRGAPLNLRSSSSPPPHLNHSSSSSSPPQPQSRPLPVPSRSVGSPSYHLVSRPAYP